MRVQLTLRHVAGRLYESKRYGPPTLRIRVYGLMVEFRELGITQREAAGMAEAVLNEMEHLQITLCDKDDDEKEMVPPVTPVSEYVHQDDHEAVWHCQDSLEKTKEKGLEADDDACWKSDLASGVCRWYDLSDTKETLLGAWRARSILTFMREILRNS